MGYGADPNRQDLGRAGYAREGGSTPLHLAANKGRLSVIDILLDAGARALICDNEDKTAVDIAERQGETECLERLLAARP